MPNEMIKKPRGTLDFFSDDARRLYGLETKLLGLAEAYGCEVCDVPMFEENKLFHRTTGESSDIVTKETFDLARKGDKDYTLRPEFTAGVNRAVVENKLYTLPDLPLRYSYFGPVFRYERPQAGRLREFHQYGVEFLDQKIDLDASLDCLLLSLKAVEAALGRKGAVKLNFLGSLESRENYKKALKAYFEPRISTMCDDCKRRLVLNPLRILDCKVPEDQEVAKGAPKIQDYLTAEDREEFNHLLKALDEIGVRYEVDDGLVRGLDYYTGLVWEIYDGDHLDVGAVGGGGKYANLMASIGGPQFEGIGFSLGVERLLLSEDEERSRVDGERKPLDVFVIDLIRDGSVLKVGEDLRALGLSLTYASFGKGLGGAFKMADRLKARAVLIAQKDGSYSFKDMESRKQVDGTKEDVLKSLQEALIK